MKNTHFAKFLGKERTDQMNNFLAGKDHTQTELGDRCVKNCVYLGMAYPDSEESDCPILAHLYLWQNTKDMGNSWATIEIAQCYDRDHYPIVGSICVDKIDGHFSVPCELLSRTKTTVEVDIVPISALSALNRLRALGEV